MASKGVCFMMLIGLENRIWNSRWRSLIRYKSFYFKLRNRRWILALKIADFTSAEIVENIGEESPKYYVFFQTTGVSTQAHVTSVLCKLSHKRAGVTSDRWDLVWKIKYWGLRTLHIILFSPFFCKIETIHITHALVTWAWDACVQTKKNLCGKYVSFCTLLN